MRAGNVIGGGDFAKDRLIPDIIKAIFEERELIIRNPKAIRPWQYVLEPLTGYLLLARCLYEEDISKIGAWNFGPNKEDCNIQVKDIVELSIKALGKGTYKIQVDSEKHEAGLLQLDIEKAKKMLNWKPIFNTETAVKKTLDWYKDFYSNPMGIKRLTVNQINDYFLKNSYEGTNQTNRKPIFFKKSSSDQRRTALRESV